MFQIEVLSEEPYEGDDLETLAYDITEGHCSGDVSEIVRNEEKTGPEMAKLLIAQRSEPGFFQLTENGEDIIEDDGLSHDPVRLVCDQCKQEFIGDPDSCLSGDYYDCWDEDGKPTYHYDCCSHDCWEKLVDELSHCDKCGRDLHQLQEHPAHPPRGLSMVEVNDEDDLICRRCAEKLGKNK